MTKQTSFKQGKAAIRWCESPLFPSTKKTIVIPIGAQRNEESPSY